MSGVFKTYPKPCIVLSEVDYNPDRIDQYGNNFRALNQHISFIDNILHEPLEQIMEIPPVHSSKSKKKHCHCELQ